MMDHATKLENLGKAVIVEYDESFADMNGHHRYGFHPPDDPYCAFPAYTGDRLVIMVVKSRHGIVASVQSRPAEDGDGLDVYLQYHSPDYKQATADQ